jgi:2,3-bisphosphoglycerate-dependent phosphoglycerate mutase
MEMVLIRHGRPADAAHPDPGLAPDGHAAAERLAEHLAGGALRRPDAVWSSPMRRALETAAPLAERLGLPVRTDERLREFDHGVPVYVAADRTTDAEERAEMWRALETGRWGEHRFDPEAFSRDVDAALAEITAQHPRGVVAVVCHSGVINAHLCSVLDRPLGMFCQLEHTSFSRLLVSPQGRRLLHTLNETAHLQVASPAPT